MKKLALYAAITGSVLVAGCNGGTPSNPAAPAAPQTKAGDSSPAPAGNAVATVNGQPISETAVAMMASEIAQRRGGTNVPEDKIVDDLIKRELLRQDAVAKGLDKDPKFAGRVENAVRMVLSQAAAEKYVADVPITDEALKQEYDKRVAAMKSTEFKARHILVDNEDVAKDIIKRLQKKEKFADLAKKLSKDPGSKANGGDLGWFNPQQMVPQFSEAVMALKNGETTQTPVKSQFGWHVIMREDSREQQPPAFDEVKEQVRNMLQSEKLQGYLAELTSKAKIDRKEPPAAPAGDAAKLPDTSLEAGKPDTGGEAAKPAAGAEPAPAEPTAQTPVEAAPVPDGEMGPGTEEEAPPAEAPPTEGAAPAKQ